MELEIDCEPKIYRHYKNKLYKLHGLAKHSETLEDMVFYEALYNNSLGRFWVRPKDMFFESVRYDGNLISRFKRETFNWTSKSEITETEIDSIKNIMIHLFGDDESTKLNSTLISNSKIHLATAIHNSKIVGFKLGYEKNEDIFYSWLGGVLPEYQKMGIASYLMKLQHKWCLQNSYKTIQTKTKNKFKNMLILNFKSGFNIVRTELSTANELKIVLEKNLYPT
jgi:ribosomal protein S18 acetylase RimI-like enzyme